MYANVNCLAACIVQRDACSCVHAMIVVLVCVCVCVCERERERDWFNFLLTCYIQLVVEEERPTSHHQKELPRQMIVMQLLPLKTVDSVRDSREMDNPQLI